MAAAPTLGATATIGYPRIGPQRELKKALEAHWKGTISEADLLSKAAAIEQDNWAAQAAADIDRIAVGDFNLYDQVRILESMLVHN